MKSNELRKCSSCGSLKPVKEFSRKGKTKKGVPKYGYCKVCERERKRKKEEEQSKDEESSYYEPKFWEEEKEEVESQPEKHPELFVESNDFKIWEEYKGDLLSSAEKVAIESTFKELILIALDMVSIDSNTNRMENV